MKHQLTQGIVLSRTDYGEADRLVTVLTPDKGKLRLMVRGARKIRSKLASGVELFSVSDLSYIKGKNEIDTLTSARLVKHFGQITRDIKRVQLGYDLIKLINRATEDAPEAAYFNLLERALEALDNDSVKLPLIRAWFEAQLLSQAGLAPNLNTDADGQALNQKSKYSFSLETMTFSQVEAGRFSAKHIKALRLLFSRFSPLELNSVGGLTDQLLKIEPLIHAMLTSGVRV